MWLKTALLVSMFWAVTATAAGGQTLHDTHEGAGVSCAICHQETPPAVAPPDALCVACHGTMLDSGPSILTPDPHHSPHLGAGEVPVCSDCHHIHRPSEVTCVMCHRGFQFDIK